MRDALGVRHDVLGIVNHGSRLSIALRPLKRFNAWSLLGCLFLAFGEFGKPNAIKTDNHPVFHAKWIKRVLRWCGVAQRFSAPGKPWQNGRIERFFGTLKASPRDDVIRDGQHLWPALSGFRIWYNAGCGRISTWQGVRRRRRGSASSRTGSRPRPCTRSARGTAGCGGGCWGIDPPPQPVPVVGC
jgi:transposase InsO family protein